jgi:Mrp family chromosome partitioning ATPase
VASLESAVAQAEAALATARRDHAENERQFTARHPAMVASAARLRDAEEVDRKAREALAAASPPDVPGERPRRERAVQAAPRTAGPSTAALAALETEYARLAREVGEERERLQILDSKHFAVSMAASSVAENATRVKVLDPAYLPTRPTGTRPKLLLAIGSALALLLAVSTCLAFAVFDDRVRDRHDIERLGLPPLLSEVPLLTDTAADDRPGSGKTSRPHSAVTRRGRHPLLVPGPRRRALPPANGASTHEGGRGALAVLRRTFPDPDQDSAEPRPGDATPVQDAVGAQLDPRLVLLRAPSSLGAASFRVLRHRITQRCSDSPGVILVTSAMVEEGKTTCALNLALALAEGGRAKVLLLDANFRRPAVSRILGLLEFETTDPWVAVEQLTPNLHVALDSQATGIDGHSLSTRVEHLLNDGYDYLVIDGPGVLGSADVNVLQESSSLVVLTVWAERTRGTAVRRAIEQIGPEKLAGIVLMGA